MRSYLSSREESQICSLGFITSELVLDNDVACKVYSRNAVSVIQKQTIIKKDRNIYHFTTRNNPRRHIMNVNIGKLACPAAEQHIKVHATFDAVWKTK